MKNRSGSIKLATIISYFSLVVSLVSTIVFTPFLLQKVGDDYGVYSLAESIVSYLTMVSTAISTSYVRFATKEAAQEDSESKKTNTVFAILMSAISVLALVAGVVIWFLFRRGVLYSDSLTTSEYNLFNKILIVSIIQCAFEILYSFFNSFIVFKKKFVPLRLAVLFSGILYPIVSYFILLFSPSMLAVVFVLYITRDVFQIALMIYSFAKLKLKFGKLSAKEFKSIFFTILVFSAFILVNTLIDTANSTIDKLLLGFVIGSSMVTIYQLGMSFRVYLTSLSLALSNNYVPIINECAVKRDIVAANSHFVKVGTFQSLLIWLIIGGFAACGREFVLLWVGAEKIDVYYIGLALMINASFPLCENISVEYQRAMNKHKFRAALYFACALLNLGITFVLLKFVPSLNPFVSCLIGTILSDFIGKWLIINIYNRKVLELNVFKLFLGYLFVGLIALTSFGLSFSFGLIFEGQSYIVLLLIKGLTFVTFFVLLSYITCFVLVHKKSGLIDGFLPATVIKLINRLCLKNSDKPIQNIVRKIGKKWAAIIAVTCLICYGGVVGSGFCFLGSKDYKYSERRQYIYFGESDLKNTSLTLKVDCTLCDKSVVTKTAERMTSASTILEVENRLFCVDIPADTYGVSFRILYTDDKPDWLKTNIYPIVEDCCFFLNFTSLSNTYNSGWQKPTFGIDSFCYYILSSIDLNSQSNLNGVNAYDDLNEVFGEILKGTSVETLENIVWASPLTGESENAAKVLDFLKCNSDSNYIVNPKKAAAILLGSLLPITALFFAAVWWRYEKD